MSFKVGDRVRLKGRPGTVGEIRHRDLDFVPEDDELYVRWDEGLASGWRYQEELELIPLSAKEYVGKVVRIAQGGDHWIVVGVDPADGWLVVRKVGHVHEYYAIDPVPVEVTGEPL